MTKDATWYHADQDSVTRSEGKSAVGLVAYITGVDLKDERTGTLCTRNHAGEVLAWGTVVASGSQAWMTDDSNLGKAWNAVEASETRKNSHTAEHWNAAGSREFSEKDHRWVAETIARKYTERHGVIVTWGIHKPTDHGDDRNWHYHWGSNMREVTPDGFGDKVRPIVDFKTRQVETIWMRGLIADVINERLALIGSQERVSHLSYKARGIDKEPTRHRGHKANQLELQGEQTEVGDYNRDIQRRNAERAANAERILNLKSEIVYLESKRRKTVMDAEQLSSSTKFEGQEARYRQVLEAKERSDEYLRAWDADRKQSERDEKERLASQRDRERLGEIDDPKARFAQSLKHWDGNPESALKVFADEYARYRESQDTLKDKIARDDISPDERKKLQLRHDIQEADYCEMVDRRTAGMSYVITGQKGFVKGLDGQSVPSQHQQDHMSANYWQAKGDALREEYRVHDRAMREEFIATYRQQKPGQEPQGPAETRTEESAAMRTVREAEQHMTPAQTAAEQRRQERWDNVQSERSHRSSVEEGVAYTREQARGGRSF